MWHLGQHRGSIPTSSSSRDPTKPSSKSFLSVPPDVSDADPDTASTKTCDNCDRQTSPIWNCSYCGMDFCDPCWGQQGPHKPGRKGPDGLPHEKADPTIVRRLKDILTPPTDHSEQRTLHIEDEDTTWFGLAKDNQGRSTFEDYGRYSAIMADSNTGEHESRYPQLVSFIGQTGAGKSTLIKMLIDQQEYLHGPREWGYPSPVVGAVTNSNVPTSGDVHLYSDPSTYVSEYPMLFADCEGLEGGENTPIKKSKRQHAVTELYPRLLYTFSDVIVFVLRNPKTFESTVLSLLISWARSSIEKSLNQPTLPHAVIALNASDTKIDLQGWDPEHSTTSLMSDVAGAIDRDPTYKELAAYWVGRGKIINNMRDLLECYYSSITVVRVPGDGRYMMINEQVQKLHDVISRRCKESFHAKRKSRMLSNSENLNVYLQSAFDHFSQDLDMPFNFMDVSFKLNPIPLDLGGNILKLAVAMKTRYDNPRKIFEELSFMVASCILLDCVRQNFKGPAEQLLEEQYLYHCDQALENFCAIFWLCTFTNRKGERCANARDRHSKGHQNERGQIIGSGAYKSDFTFDDFAESWGQYLHNHVIAFQTELSNRLMQPPPADELIITTKLHQLNATRFYQRLGGAQPFVSHTTCFCCLRELSEHPLPCGHVLCTPCIKSYGKQHKELSASYIMASCPLHDYDTVFTPPWPVYFKPPLAGVRILSLDGGGMRGIVILEVLRCIQSELGHHIPIQDFFDLIVGTSTGGIIALGLGVKNWSVSDCSRWFLSLVRRAFDTRIPGGFRFNKSKYRTKPLEDVLKECFGEEAMFGGVPEIPSGYARKVAVTAATETGEQAVIFTNYNRADDAQVGYRLIRQDNPNNDLKIREAARATSAAPTYFKPFVNSRTKEGFIDGAVFHNNPVRIANYESKLLWPDAEEWHPDILLSIGTAHHESDDDGCQATKLSHGNAQARKMLDQVTPAVRKKRSTAFKGFSEVGSWVKMCKKRVESVLDAELTWRDFRNDVLGKSSPIAAQRYVRFNPKTKSPVPRMDDTGDEKVAGLREEIKRKLCEPGMKTLARTVADRLVASSFYFEKIGPTRANEDVITFHGAIACRFAAGSNNLRFLGYHIRSNFQRRNFQPFFRVHEVKHDKDAQDIEITRKVLEDMIDSRFFFLDTITIPVTSESALLSIDLHLTNDQENPALSICFPISGFPRSFADGEPLKRTTSPTSPTPELPKISNKRQSLRERKRNINGRISLEQRRAVSDGDIKYGQRDGAGTPQSLNPSIPEMPDHESDWTSGQIGASRPPPKGVQSMVDLGISSSIQQLDEAVSRFINGRVSPYDDEMLTLVSHGSRDDSTTDVTKSDTGTDSDT
ncbi:Nn.00g084610.m01.CDS01 [Neocucurbitaria sp. VM-36]